MGLGATQLITLAKNRLGGLANAVTPDQLLAFLNEGKDELWAVLKQGNERFFVTSTQATDNTKINYFAPLSLSVREYTLPSNLRDIIFIETIAPTGFETTKFVFRPMLHPDFRDARNWSTAAKNQATTIPQTGIGVFYYDIVGQSTLVLAQYPDLAYTITIWYVQNLPDMLVGGTQSDIVDPYNKYIADYAVMKIMLIKDPPAFVSWREQWRIDVVNTMQSARRDSADPIFSASFEGEIG